MALSAAGSALVAGGVSPEENAMSKMVSVEVVRAFYYNGAPTRVGSVIEVPVTFAAELIAARKAKAHEPPADAKAPIKAAAKDDGEEPAKPEGGNTHAR